MWVWQMWLLVENQTKTKKLKFHHPKSWLPCVIPGSWWMYQDAVTAPTTGSPYSFGFHAVPKTGTVRPILSGQGGSVVRPFPCNACPSVFSSPKALTQHKNSAHKTGTGQHACSICGKRITRKDDFEDHLNKHRNIRAHSCPHCSHTFFFKNNLRQHLRASACSKQRNSTQ